MKFFTVIPALAALICGATAHAQQDFPTRPLRVVVFVPAGGGADLLARVVSQKLGDALGQTVVVDNRPGSGGVIGANVVAKAAPDGCTLALPRTASARMCTPIYLTTPSRISPRWFFPAPCRCS